MGEAAASGLTVQCGVGGCRPLSASHIDALARAGRSLHHSCRKGGGSPNPLLLLLLVPKCLAVRGWARAANLQGLWLWAPPSSTPALCCTACPAHPPPRTLLLETPSLWPHLL